MKDYTYRIDNRHPEEKKRFIRSLFDSIVPTYDLLNHVLSLGTDWRWRRQIIQHVPPVNRKNVLDAACGTGDVARMLAKKGARVTALDFSLAMLQRGRRKKALGPQTVAADAGQMPLQAATFDLVTIAFGIRNIPDIDLFLEEAFRVLAPGGQLVILELIRPANPLIARGYAFYLNRLLPVIGGLVSGQIEAYRYLAQTIATFIDPDNLAGRLHQHGFARTAVQRQWPGMAAIIMGTRPET